MDNIGALNSQWAIKIDSLVKVMLVVVLSVSSLVHIYSLGYMRDDHNWRLGKSIEQDFSLIYLFTFAMLVLLAQTIYYSCFLVGRELELHHIF